MSPDPSMLTLRPARLSDLDALVDLENRVFPGDRLSRRSLRYYSANPRSFMPVCLLNGRFAGYALVAFRKNSTIARLYSLAVEPDCGGRGVGQALMQASENAARARRATRLELEVRTDNAAAIALYFKRGYEHFDDYEDFYEDGMDAMRFAKTLEPADTF